MRVLNKAITTSFLLFIVILLINNNHLITGQGQESQESKNLLFKNIEIPNPHDWIENDHNIIIIEFYNNGSVSILDSFSIRIIINDDILMEKRIEYPIKSNNEIFNISFEVKSFYKIEIYLDVYNEIYETDELDNNHVIERSGYEESEKWPTPTTPEIYGLIIIFLLSAFIVIVVIINLVRMRKTGIQ